MPNSQLTTTPEITDFPPETMDPSPIEDDPHKKEEASTPELPD